MKKSILLLVSMLLFVACADKKATIDLAEMDSKMKATFEDILRARGGANVNVAVAVERLARLDNSSDFYFYKIVLTDLDKNVSQDQYLFFNGKYVSSDFVDLQTNTPASKLILFEKTSYTVDVSKLTLAYGKPDAKHIIVEVSDVECPYCRLAYNYLEEKLKDRDDVAIYFAHLPLKNHPNAEIGARIFEAGKLMGKDFKQELFTNDLVLNANSTPDQLAEYFAAQSGDADKFMSLLNSDEVNTKLQNSAEIVSELKVTSTPSFVINGKRIEGFDKVLIDRALGF